MKKSKVILVIVLTILVIVGVTIGGICLTKKESKSSVKYQKVELVQYVMPFEGSNVLVNKADNFVFLNTYNDLGFDEIKIYDGKKEIDQDTIVEKDKTYTYEIFISAIKDNLKELIDENTSFVVNTADGVLNGTVDLKDDNVVFKYDYKVRGKKDALPSVSVSLVLDGEEFENISVNKNLSFRVPDLIFMSGELENEKGLERAKMNYGGIKVNGKKQTVKEAIKLDKDAVVEYYIVKDERKSINNVDIKTNFNEKFKVGTSINELKAVNKLAKNVDVEFEFYEAAEDIFEDEVIEKDTLKAKKYRIHGYLDYKNSDKTIFPDLKITIDGEEVKNYYLTKQYDSTTLYFYFEKEIKEEK